MPRPLTSFNPWYVGGGVKSMMTFRMLWPERCFNPWYVGGGVKRDVPELRLINFYVFQSLVCWRGC